MKKSKSTPVHHERYVYTSHGVDSQNEAENIYFTELINLFQGPINLQECFIKRSICPDINSCLLKEKIEKIREYAIAELEPLTIKSISKKEKKDGAVSK